MFGMLWTAVFVALSAIPSSGAETVIVTKAFHEREIKVRVGAIIQVELEQAGATGFLWEVRALDTEHFELLSVETGAEPADPEITGAPIAKTWQIRAIVQGLSELQFLYYRPWEGPEQAADSLVLRVRIL